MFFSHTDIGKELGDFVLDGAALPYNRFIARLYNYCRSLGFESGKILPSRAFCSDENQGYPIILIAKHFGAFPFNHGRVGGIVATDRHGPHAHHGQDLVIIHASHVGYDPATREYGVYRRVHTEHFESTAACGKIEHVLAWYRVQYAFAQQNIILQREGDEQFVTIDNALLKDDKPEGLVLHIDQMVAGGQQGRFHPRRSSSTAKCYAISPEFRAILGEDAWPHEGGRMIGHRLLAQLFHFQRVLNPQPEAQGMLEANLLTPMPWIVSSRFPLLTAAQANTMIEFDRTYRTLLQTDAYHGKRLLFLSGLNIDVSPHGYQAFPLTYFVPWAAFVKDEKGNGVVLEQPNILDRLLEQSEENPDQLDLELSIKRMEGNEDVTTQL